MTIERTVRALRHDLGGQEVIWSKQFTLQTKTEARNTKLREKKGKKKRGPKGFFLTNITPTDSIFMEN